MKLAEQVCYSRLLDFYGGMLTQNQCNIMRSYVDFNATLEEIATTMGTTRQAVSDVLRRSIAKLMDMENRLGLVAKFEAILNQVPAIAKKISPDECMQAVITKEFTTILKTLED